MLHSGTDSGGNVESARRREYSGVLAGLRFVSPGPLSLRGPTADLLQGGHFIEMLVLHSGAPVHQLRIGTTEGRVARKNLRKRQIVFDDMARRFSDFGGKLGICRAPGCHVRKAAHEIRPATATRIAWGSRF